MKLNVVDKNYFVKKIRDSELVLCSVSVTKETEVQIKTMQKTFREYAGLKSELKKTKELSVSEMLTFINEKLNLYLSHIDIKSWHRIKDMCNSVRKITCPTHAYLKKAVDVNDLAKESLKVYRGADKEFYLAAKSALEDENTLIYLNNLMLDNYFRCRYLNNSIISCHKDGYNTYPSFIHELSHHIDRKLFTHIQYLYSELTPIFFELLMYDHINKKGNYSGLVGYRINDHNMRMKEIIDYIEILTRFDNYGRKLTLKNAGFILDVEDEIELRSLYNDFCEDDIILITKYILSFMKAIQIRHIFYDHKKEGISKLKASVAGAEANVNYQLFIKEYNAYTHEVERQRVKQQLRRF